MNHLPYTERYALQFLREGPTADRSVVLILGENGPAALRALEASGLAILCRTEGQIDHWQITAAGRAALKAADSWPAGVPT